MIKVLKPGVEDVLTVDLNMVYIASRLLEFIRRGAAEMGRHICVIVLCDCSVRGIHSPVPVLPTTAGLLPRTPWLTPLAAPTSTAPRWPPSSVTCARPCLRRSTSPRRPAT